MAIVKKDTIDREAFEQGMSMLKTMVRRCEDPEVVVKSINDITHRLIEYTDEKNLEKFHIPDWINQDVTVSVQRRDIEG